jgi:hypothetical protein
MEALPFQMCLKAMPTAGKDRRKNSRADTPARTRSDRHTGDNMSHSCVGVSGERGGGSGYRK